MILDHRLKNNCFFVKDLELSRLLLMNNNNYPWLILVPKRCDIVELIDLNNIDQQMLLKEINQISNLLQKIFNPDKINIAALGNVVQQLHIHVIARFKNDNSFPNPVWCDDCKIPYNLEEKDKLIAKIIQNI